MLQQRAQPGGHRCSRSPGCVMASKQFFTFAISAMIQVVALLMDRAAMAPTAGEKRGSSYSSTSFWS